SALDDAPRLPTALPDGLTTEGLQEIRDAAEKLGDAWRPVAEGPDFPWRDLTGSGQPHMRLRLLRERADVLQRRLAVHSDLTGPLGLAELGAPERLLTLLDATGARPDVPQTWLTAPDLATLRADVTEFIARLDELRAATSALARDIGPRW